MAEPRNRRQRKRLQGPSIRIDRGGPYRPTAAWSRPTPEDGTTAVFDARAGKKVRAWKGDKGAAEPRVLAPEPLAGRRSVNGLSASRRWLDHHLLVGTARGRVLVLSLGASLQGVSERAPGPALDARLDDRAAFENTAPDRPRARRRPPSWPPA